MSIFTNMISISIGDMVYIDVKEQKGSDSKTLETIVMRYEFLKELQNLINNTIDIHDEKLAGVEAKVRSAN